MDTSQPLSSADQGALENFQNFTFYSEERKLALLGELQLLVEHYRGMQEIRDEHLGIDDEGRWVVDDLTAVFHGAIIHLLYQQ